MVAVNDCNEAGFLFFTNYESKKAKELDANPRAAACFYWDPLERQIVMNGRVERISRQDSIKYFSQRSYETRLTSLISQQGKPIMDKQELFSKYYEANKEFENKSNQVPVPENW